MKPVLFLLVCITAIACHTGTSKVSVETTATGYSDSAVQVADSTHPKDRSSLNYKIDTSGYLTKNLLLPRDTLVTVNLHNGKGSVKAYISGIGKHVTIVVPVTGGDSIKAELVPENNSQNIRFKQIFIPVGKQGRYDGPFSRTLSYPVTVKGNYKLIVGTNLMADGDPKGSFTCNVTVK